MHNMNNGYIYTVVSWHTSVTTMVCEKLELHGLTTFRHLKKIVKSKGKIKKIKTTFCPSHNKTAKYFSKSNDEATKHANFLKISSTKWRIGLFRT